MKRILPKDAHLIPKSAKKVFEGEIFDVYHWQQKMFDGSYARFEMLKRADTVSVFPVVGDKLLVTKQLQASWKDYKYGFPGGRVDADDESLLSALKREVYEETGYRFKKWKLIEVIQREEKIEWFHYKYVAIEPLGEPDQISPDNGEKIEVELLSFDEVKALLKDHPRLGQGILEDIASLEGLTNYKEYKV